MKSRILDISDGYVWGPRTAKAVNDVVWGWVPNTTGLFVDHAANVSEAKALCNNQERLRKVIVFELEDGTWIPFTLF